MSELRSAAFAAAVGAGVKSLRQTQENQNSAISTIETAITSVDGIVLGAPSIVTESDQVLTVGPGGQFASLNAALYTASKVARAALGARLDIKLLPGFVMAEQVAIERIDLGFIRIQSDAAEVPIVRSALTTPYHLDYPAFAAFKRAELPVIACLFVMDDSGVGIGRTGIMVVDKSGVTLERGAGIKNCPMRGLHVANKSDAVARGAVFTGCGFEPRYEGGGAAIRVSNGGAEVRECDLTGNAIGLMLAALADVDAEDTDVSGCGIGIENYESEIRFGMGKAIGCGTALKSFRGGINHARAADFSGATGARAIDLAHNSQMDAAAINVSGAAGFALYSSGSRFEGYAPNFSGAGEDAVSAYGGSVGIRAANLRDAARYGASAYEGVINLNAQDADATGAGTHGFYWENGSTINANLATGTFARERNTQSRHGICYGPV